MTSTPISKTEVEAEIRKVLFGNSRAFATRPKDYDIVLDEKGVNDTIKALTLLLERREAEARIDESKLYEDWFNNDSTTHIEDFIEDRITELKASLNQGGEDEPHNSSGGL